MIIIVIPYYNYDGFYCMQTCIRLDVYYVVRILFI